MLNHITLIVSLDIDTAIFLIGWVDREQGVVVLILLRSEVVEQLHALHFLVC